MALGKRKRTLTGDSGDVPSFIKTLYSLLEECDPAIGRWSDDGTQVVIVDPARFAAEICPKFFRHRNFNSFTRLLNMYQFHKVQGTSQDSKFVCFSHDKFGRGQEDQLSLIQRKSNSNAEGRDGQPKSGVEALVTRDVWEKTNQEIDKMQEQLHSETSTAVRLASSSTPADPASAQMSTWMRKVVLLEREVRSLREQNDRLRKLDIERAELYKSLATQNKKMNELQAIIQLRQDLVEKMPLDPMSLVLQSMRQTKSCDPIANAIQDMGHDPATVLNNLGLASEATSPEALAACLESFLNPICPTSAEMQQYNDQCTAAQQGEPWAQLFGLLGTEAVLDDSLMHVTSHLQDTMPPLPFQEEPEHVLAMCKSA